MPCDCAERHMIGELRDEWKRLHTRKTPADDAEIQCCDGDAGDGAAGRAARPGPVEHERPREREREVQREGGGEQLRARALTWQHDRAGSVRGLEWVATRRERMHARGNPAQRCCVQGGSKDAQDRRIGLDA